MPGRGKQFKGVDRWNHGRIVSRNGRQRRAFPAVSNIEVGFIAKYNQVVLDRQICDRFDVVIWRSLREAPPPDKMLDTLLKCLNPLEADFSETGPNDWLVRKVPFTNLELSFMATKADQEVAEFLDAPVGDPLFTAERITWISDAPVTYAKLFFAPGYRMTTHI